MPVTIRIATRAFQRPLLRLALVAALLPLPLTVLSAACSTSGSGEGGVSATASVAPDQGSPPGMLAGQTAEQAEATRRELTRTASDTPLDGIGFLNESLTGDLDAMIERRVIRALVPISKTTYFLDGADQHGMSYEAAKLFEQRINEASRTGNLNVHVVMVPVARDQLIEGVVAGYGDIALGNITITPERSALVDFSDPLYVGVKEIVVTGPGSPELESLDDLGGNEVYVRPSSSYYQSLLELNERLRSEGKDEVTLTPAPEVLEDEDLLEMVNAGLVPIVVVDSHKAQFWAQIYDDLVMREDLAVAVDQRIGWAFRKNSPLLAAAINEFVAENKKGTLMGNMVFNRYLRDTKWAKRALDDEGRARLQSLVEIFQRYGEQYDMPWLLVAAQGYQESGLDQSVRSPAGAVGVMQLLPSTAADPSVGIPDIHEVENNIHAGVKYLRFVHDRYFADDADMTEIDKGLFAFAAYNAGPARVAGLRRKAEAMGLDPDVWFHNVEIVASQEIGRETVQYVSNIYKYYIAYQRMLDLSQARQRARDGA